VLVLAFVEDGYSELHMDAWDFLAGLLIFEEAGGMVSGASLQSDLKVGGLVLAVALRLAAISTLLT
jgi:myo-inositol-1(or 4)-monophosphatase